MSGDFEGAYPLPVAEPKRRLRPYLLAAFLGIQLLIDVEFLLILNQYLSN